MTPTCQAHPRYPKPETCAGCKAAADKAAERARIEGRAHSAQESSAARERARIRRAEIDECWMCDEDGYRNGGVCNHNTNASMAATKGMALIREQWRRREEGHHGEDQ